MFDYEIDGVAYLAYSQCVPSTVTREEDRDKIEFYLLLLQEKASVTTDQVAIQTAITGNLWFCVIIIISTLIAVGGLALIFGWLTARSITMPIKEMDVFTRRMKQAPSLVEKIKIVGDMSSSKSYLSVNKQYT